MSQDLAATDQVEIGMLDCSGRMGRAVAAVVAAAVVVAPVAADVAVEEAEQEGVVTVENLQTELGKIAGTGEVKSVMAKMVEVGSKQGEMAS